MIGMLAAVPWHYWIGVSLVLGTIPAVLAAIGGYFYFVTRTRYPKNRR